jgi:penicillin G amidase
VTPYRRPLMLFVPPLLGALVWLYTSLRTAEPLYTGVVPLAGLEAPVQLSFGPHAVPSIQARDVPDLLFAQGYQVAAERMWQMDLLRRLAQGRLAELLGAGALPVDRLYRTLGLGAAARRALADLAPPYRAWLAAYAAGVNAYQAQAARRLPLEYRIIRSRPAPWQPADSLAIGTYMAWALSYDVRRELVFLRLAQRLGNRRAAELLPSDMGVPAPRDAADLPRLTALPRLGGLAGRLASLLGLPARWGLPVPTAASNAWALSGAHTTDGGSLLANDPHLAPSTPGIWYELELQAPGLHLAGVALPGVPLVLIGHNPDLAWGFTTSNADTQDLFIERPSPDGIRVERPGGTWEPVQMRTEWIRVRGRARPVPLVVRSTSHGVVLNGVLGNVTGTSMDLPALDTRELLALRWPIELPDRAFAGFADLATATTLAQARAAGREITLTSQNLMLAHRDGGIAWEITGRLPLRGRGSGAFPSPGWEPGYGWTGYVPAADNPGRSAPPDGVLITANNRTVPVDGPVKVSHSWSAPYRARRIAELISEGPPQDAASATRMQLDRVSLQARGYLAALGRLLPRLRARAPQAAHIAERDLLPWDGTFSGDSRPAALFTLLRPALYRALYGDELAGDLDALMDLELALYSPLDEAILSGKSSFWDDRNEAGTQDAVDVWARALREADRALTRLLPGRSEQRLDRLHSVTFPHALARIPLLGPLLSVGPIPLGGDAATINLAKASPVAPREVLFIPSCRMVLRPADWPAARVVVPPGQSGHPLSPYYADQIDDWLSGHPHALPWGGPRADKQLGLLTLVPAQMPSQGQAQ